MPPPPYVPPSRSRIPREEPKTEPARPAVNMATEAEVRRRLLEAEREIRLELAKSVPDGLPPSRSEFPSQHDLENQKEIAETKLALKAVQGTLEAQDKVLAELRAQSSQTQAHVEVSPKLVAAEVDKARDRGRVLAALIQPVVAVIIAAAFAAWHESKPSAAPVVVYPPEQQTREATPVSPVVTEETAPADAGVDGGRKR